MGRICSVAILLSMHLLGLADYVCCQGYIPKCCCFDYPNMCKGSQLGLCCEGCCFDTLSLSITRIYVVSHVRAIDVVSKAPRRVELFFCA
jgi:hypothetical protein